MLTGKAVSEYSGIGMNLKNYNRDNNLWSSVQNCLLFAFYNRGGIVQSQGNIWNYIQHNYYYAFTYYYYAFTYATHICGKVGSIRIKPCWVLKAQSKRDINKNNIKMHNKYTMQIYHVNIQLLIFTIGLFYENYEKRWDLKQ